MDKQQQIPFPDEEMFADLLTGSDGLPPDEVVGAVTPWKKAIKRILIGMVLMTITLNFWNLNYLLPLIGVILLLLGLRTLRKENRWLKGCFYLAVLRLGVLMVQLLGNTTIRVDLLMDTLPYSGQLQWAVTFLGIGLVLGTVLCLWQGLRAIRQKAGLPPDTHSGAALLVWYGVTCILAFVNYNGLILPLAMLIAYLLIIRSIFKLSHSLDEAGYLVKPSPVRLPDWAVTVVIVSILAAGAAISYLFLSGYPMDWQPVETVEFSERTEICEQLIQLGFPEEILDDLTDEDILACQDAVTVVVDTHSHPVNDGREVMQGTENHRIYRTVYDVKELRITGIAVQLAGERESWKIFHHFVWKVDPGFPGTESIQIWPAWRLSEGWWMEGEVSGRLLVDRDGQTYTAPYACLGSQSYTSNSFLFGGQPQTDLFAAFSLPRWGENKRGYVSYAVSEVSDGWIIDSWFNYTHQRSWLQYPVQSAMENQMSGSWNLNSVFKEVQDALQFHSTEEGIKMLS